MDALLTFAFYIGSIALSVALVAYVVYDCIRYENGWKARSRCPGCGRWRYMRSWSCVHHAFIFECRKCGMIWMDIPKE